MRAALVALCLLGCGEAMVITRPAELDAAVGKTVTLRGTVSNTKIATLAGADVDSDAPDLRGRAAEASGVLERVVVTQAGLDATIAAQGQIPNRGAGTFYRLIDPRTRTLARVQKP